MKHFMPPDKTTSFFTCLFILFSVCTTQAIEQAYLAGNTSRVRLARLARQADELVPIHEANNSILEEIDASVTAGFGGTFTTIEQMATGQPIKLSSADISSNVITISSSGYYQLTENVTCQVSIAANNVDLDLNNYTVSWTVSANNIVETNTSGRSNITIRNGKLEYPSGGGSGSGIYIYPNSSNISIDNVTIYGKQFGIYIGGSSGNENTNCKITNCRTIDCETGFLYVYSQNGLIENCIAQESHRFAIWLSYCESCCVRNCTCLKYGINNSSPRGIIVDYGSNNRIERCLVQYTEDSNSSITTTYSGIFVRESSQTEVFKCNVQVVKTPSGGNEEAQPHGIYLFPNLEDTGDLLTTVTAYQDSADIVNIHWSPDERYIASVRKGSNDTGWLLGFNGTALDRLGNINAFNDTNEVIRWSPSGSYLAVSYDNAENSLRMYRFYGAATTLTPVDRTVTNPITDLAWSPDGKFIATVESDASGTISIFAVSADHSEISPAISTATVGSTANCIGWSPDGSFIAVGLANSDLYLYSVNNGYLSFEDSDSTAAGAINDLAWAPQGAFIATGDANSDVRIFAISGSSPTTLVAKASNSTAVGSVNGVAWSPTGEHVVSGDNNGNSAASTAYVRVYTYNQDTTLTHVKGVDTAGFSVNKVDWSPSGRYIATCDDNDYVRIYTAMDPCESCCVIGNTVSGISSSFQICGVGFAPGGGNNFWADNKAYNNECNYQWGMPGVYYGTQNITKPFDNVSMPLVY